MHHDDCTLILISYNGMENKDAGLNRGKNTSAVLQRCCKPKRKKKKERISKSINSGAACAPTPQMVKLHSSHSAAVPKHNSVHRLLHRSIAVSCPWYPEHSQGSREQDCIQLNLSSWVDPSPTGILRNIVHAVLPDSNDDPKQSKQKHNSQAVLLTTPWLLLLLSDLTTEL